MDGVQVPPQMFGRNCLKCADLQRKNVYTPLYGSGVGIEVKYHIFS